MLTKGQFITPAIRGQEVPVVLTVVMITYNQENYLRAAIEGVLLQQCNFPWTLVISDDASTDSTSEVVQSYCGTENKIRYIRRQKNLGCVANFVETLKSITSKYIALCEGDDYWVDPLKLQKQFDHLESRPNCVLCFHDVKVLKSDGSIVPDFITNVPQIFSSINSLAFYGNFIHTPSVVFRNVLTRYPDEIFQSPIGDYFLYMLLAQYGEIGRLSDQMSVYRYESGIWSSLGDVARTKGTIKCLLLLAKIFRTDNNIYPILENRIKKYLQFLLPRLDSSGISFLRLDDVCSQMLDKFLLSVFREITNKEVGKVPTIVLAREIIHRFLRKIRRNVFYLLHN